MQDRAAAFTSMGGSHPVLHVGVLVVPFLRDASTSLAARLSLHIQVYILLCDLLV